jgi:hypothetical protein
MRRPRAPGRRQDGTGARPERPPEDAELLAWVGDILMSPKPTLVSEISPRLVDGIADPEWRAILQQLGFRSGMAVPLVAGDEVVGLLTLANGESPTASTNRTSPWLRRSAGAPGSRSRTRGCTANRNRRGPNCSAPTRAKTSSSAWYRTSCAHDHLDLRRCSVPAPQGREGR